MAKKAELIPPDLKRCQAEIPKGSFMGMGNPVRMERCRNIPTFVIVEKKKGKDGRKGSMTLCESCFVVASNQVGGTFTTKKIGEDNG